MDIQAVKDKLINNIDTLVRLLEIYGFEKITPKDNEIRFARDIDGGLNISIPTINNPQIYVRDFARDISCDIISYIIKEKGKTFKDVLATIKEILISQNDYIIKSTVSNKAFGGVYTQQPLTVYQDTILDDYLDIGNKRFVDDGISLDTQKIFNIRYDIVTNRIIIPIYNECGEIVGIKGRLNEEVTPQNPKYLYLVKCKANQVLYGYHQNYDHLQNSTIIITEAEKSVMQSYDFGIRNVVALSGNSISKRQAELVYRLNPKRIILALDKGLEFSLIKRDIDILTANNNCNAKILYWDATKDNTVEDKSSPTDMGREKFIEIMKEQLVEVK